MPNETIGALGFAVLAVLVLLGMPIGFAFMFTGLGGLLLLRGVDTTLGFARFGPFGATESTVLTVLPLFILMGNFLIVSGTATELFDAAYKWVGRFRGGLAYATILGVFGFSVISGSSAASTATFGRVALPEMKARGYDDRLSSGTIAAGATMDILVPPSITAVLYGLITETSIGKVLIAGFLPGFVVMASYFVVIFVLLRWKPGWAPSHAVTVTWRERFASLKGIMPTMVIMMLVMGTIYLGIATPTEAAAVGAVCVFALVAVRGKLSKAVMSSTFRGTMESTVMVLVILIGASVFTVFLTVSGVAQTAASHVINLGLPPLQFYIVLILLYIFLGMFLDPLAMMLITLPFLMPVVRTLGWDPVWFGIFIIRMAGIGLITPPLGLNVYVLKGVAPGVKLNAMWIGVAPFIVADMFTLALFYAFPDIILVLPRMMR
ncbi:MAG: TRAP transporter large permease [Dehalococcoidia bacterium]|nr:TRAP transporter large permease [Dehalococcoidia bacterium]